MKKAIIAIVMIMVSINSFATGTVLINGRSIKSKDDLQLALIKNLNLPKYNGKSLESLSDYLVMDSNGEYIIKVKNVEILKARLGVEYVNNLLQVITDASEENPKLILVLE